MSKIKGLYFKLNIETKRDKIIYNFFNTLDQPANKVDALYYIICAYVSRSEYDELATMCIDNKEGTEHGQNK